jgi:hypothetical protein
MPFPPVDQKCAVTLSPFLSACESWLERPSVVHDAAWRCAPRVLCSCKAGIFFPRRCVMTVCSSHSYLDMHPHPLADVPRLLVQDVSTAPQPHRHQSDECLALRQRHSRALRRFGHGRPAHRGIVSEGRPISRCGQHREGAQDGQCRDRQDGKGKSPHQTTAGWFFRGSEDVSTEKKKQPLNCLGTDIFLQECFSEGRGAAYQA